MFGSNRRPKGNYTFGAAENEYSHSSPEEYIRVRDPDALEEMLRQAEAKGLAKFEASAFKRTNPPQELKWLLIELTSAFGLVENCFQHLKEAQKAAGDKRGMLVPYKRPDTGNLDLDKIKKDNSRQHLLGVAMLKYKLEIDLLEAAQVKLKEACANFKEKLPHFEHNEVQLLVKHNVMCADSLLHNSWSYVFCLVRVEPQEYTTMTKWIVLQWERFVSRKETRY